MLADVFDGPASYNHKRGTQANTRFVVDCPLANEREVSELVIRLARQIGIGANANFARKHLQGGNPRKTQLRLSASEAKRFFESVGLASPKKTQRACKLYGCEETIERSPAQLPALKQFVAWVTLGVRSLKPAGRSSEPHSARRKTGAITKKATTPEPSDCFISVHSVSPTRSNCPPEHAKPKKHFSDDGLFLIGIGTHMTHKKFSEGVIVSKNDEYLIVSPDGKDRKFAWPSAFEDGFLELI